MTTELIEFTVESGVATVSLNRPEKRNAMNDELRVQFVDALERASMDRAVRALVLTGNGKAFCAGGDVEAMSRRLQVGAGEVGFNGWERQQRIHHAQSLLRNLSIPTIAAVNGAAAGLGADMALACDFIVASQEATFTWPYVHRGLVPDGGGMYLLPRRVGLTKAKDLIFSGRRVEAEEALHLGIADRLTTVQALLTEAQAWAVELSRGSRTATALTKNVLNNSFELSAEQIAAQGSLSQGICYTSTEHRAAVEAFLQKGAARPDKKGM
jgi:enoyl-CoA hydratase/carnithine racemase